MRKLFLLITIFSPVLLFAQGPMTKNIVSINTSEKNKKTILFKKQTVDNGVSFVLQAENQSSKDFTKCKWVASLSKEELMCFIDGLESLEVGSSVETHLFNFSYKKNKVKVQIKNTKCTSEHKMYYFQQSCNRTLSFVILAKESSDMLTALKQIIGDVKYVSK